MTEEKVYIPISERAVLTLNEACEYAQIGLNKMQKLCTEPGCTFSFRNGNRHMIKKKEFDEWLRTVEQI